VADEYATDRNLRTRAKVQSRLAPRPCYREFREDARSGARCRLGGRGASRRYVAFARSLDELAGNARPTYIHPRQPMRAAIWPLLPLVLLSSMTTAARADDANPTADELAQKTLDHDTFGFEGTEIHARLILTDAGASTPTQERAFLGISKKGDNHLIKSVIRFTSPENVAGTAFLMIQHAGAPDEQYIYLSRMKTTRRIGGTGERAGSFMGSDFSYADLERKDVRDARYARLADEPIGKDPCFVLQATPNPGTAVYSRVVMWVRQKDWIPLRVQMYGGDGQLEKTMFTRRVRVVDGRPVVVESHTENARTHHTTDLVLDEVQFKSDLPDAAFVPAALEHG
jgi:hypothetical protein